MHLPAGPTGEGSGGFQGGARKGSAGLSPDQHTEEPF
jgi:hypothetical protein